MSKAGSWRRLQTKLKSKLDKEEVRGKATLAARIESISGHCRPQIHAQELPQAPGKNASTLEEQVWLASDLVPPKDARNVVTLPVIPLRD